jgi:type I restriction enzyme S subunit
MEEWKEYKIGDLCSKVCSGGTPSSKHSEYYDGDIPWLNTKEINFNRIYATEKCITEEGLNNSSAKWIEENSVIVAMYGATAGKTAIAKIPLTTNQACCNLTINPSVADYRFVYYYLCYKFIELASLANGGAQQNLNAQIIKDFQITLPSKSEQERIALILSSLDDKIEVNRRINDNLEQQGQLLFEEFVMNPNSPRTQLLGDYAFINPARTIAKGRTARCIDMSSLPTKGTFPNDWTFKEYNGGMKFQNGDTIMARITPCLENGKTAYINFLDEGEVAFGSTEYIVLSPQDGLCPELLYFLARHDDFVSYAVAHMNGSSGRQRVSGNDIANYVMPEISSETMNVISEKLHGIMEVIKNNSLESRCLAELRDTLLPRLMSGELKL